MNKSVKHEEFDKFRIAINISIDNIYRRLDKLNIDPANLPSRQDLLNQYNLNQAKFDTLEEAINLIFTILDSNDMKIDTCMHCNQPLPKADNES
jgi:hypothetical protein